MISHFHFPQQRGQKGEKSKPSLGRGHVWCPIEGPKVISVSILISMSPTVPLGCPHFSLEVLSWTTHTVDNILEQLPHPAD